MRKISKRLPLQRVVKIVHIRGGPTFQEKAVLLNLSSAEAAFRAMEGVTSEEVRDFATGLRMLERQVLARCGQRGLAEAQEA